MHTITLSEQTPKSNTLLGLELKDEAAETKIAIEQLDFKRPRDLGHYYYVEEDGPYENELFRFHPYGYRY